MFTNSSQTSKAKPWFPQPKYMPDWLYRFFGETIKPLITVKNVNDGRCLARPLLFTDDKFHAPATMWIHPPDAVFHLSHGTKLDPTILYRLCVFLWLPHFFVTNSIAQVVKQGFCRKMAHSALAASSMFTTTSTLFHGHTIAVIHANITMLDGAQRSLNHSHDTCILHFQQSFHKKVVCHEVS